MEQLSRATLRDHLEVAARYAREARARVPIIGYGAWVLSGPEGQVRDAGEFENLVTQIGDQYYADRAAGIGSIPVVTGMQLGTGSTTPSKTGAGAAIGTLVASSLVALSVTPVSSLQGSARRILYSVSWGTGVATSNGITEAVLVNQSVGTQTAAAASATVSRAIVTPTVNKAAGDTLAIAWAHELLGA